MTRELSVSNGLVAPDRQCVGPTTFRVVQGGIVSAGMTVDAMNNNPAFALTGRIAFTTTP